MRHYYDFSRLSRHNNGFASILNDNRTDISPVVELNQINFQPNVGY